MHTLHNLQRFVEAQSPVYDQVLRELRAGRKTTHWMWYVFPQVEGLGHSPMARKYAIRSKAEARAYLEHGILGARLRECVDCLLALEGLSAGEIFGPIDKLKLRSSLTLFGLAAPDDERRFADALERYYGGGREPATIAILALL